MTTLFGTAAMTTATPIDARPPRKKRGWLPLLTVLFCLSYALMTMLIVEQGETIESQRALIRELFRDSAELTATKMKAQIEKNSHAPSAKAPAAQTPSTQTPSNQTPSTQVPSNQAPSTQAPSAMGQDQSAMTQHRGQTSIQKAAPQTPSRPATDLVDARRSLLTI